jgi:ssDNA thymidine ADP-ribosyltransferase, DarT
MPVPDPTPIFRFVHVDNLEIALRRGGLHAPNHTPNDGLAFKTIHNTEIQEKRQQKPVTCGPRGVIHDYVPFYFGYLSPMMLQLNTGRVAGYNEGQEPLIYLVSTAQAVRDSGTGFAFSDGHGIATFTSWYDDLNQLSEVDWNMVYQRYWADNINDMDRQRKKQAEFLVHRCCDWSLIQEVGVLNVKMKTKVEGILSEFDADLHRPVTVQPNWYY